MKKIIVAIVIIVLLVLAYIFLAKPMIDKKVGVTLKAPCEEQVDSLNNVIVQHENAYLELEKKLNECMGVMTVEEELAATKKALADANAKLARKPATTTTAPAPPKRKVVKRTAPKEDVTETDFSENSFRVNSTTTITTPTVNYASASTQFFGQKKGSYFTSIDADGYLMYGISKNLSPQAPRLNGVGGELFSDAGSYWTYVDKTRLVSVAEINIETVIWTVYIGNKNYGTGSYPMFLPHETLKPLIVETRGYDYGAITSGDIQRMSQTNPLVGKSLIPNSSDGHAANDKNFWNGWSFKTKIVAVKKTTTTSSEISVISTPKESWTFAPDISMFESFQNS